MSAYKEYRFSDLIEEVEERNISLEYGLDDIVGVTIEKGLIPTIANLTQTALDKFYIVKPDTFVYNPRTHGVRLGMGYNDTNKTFLTSWNNVAFRVKEDAKKIVLSKYLWIYFNRPEWDRQTNFMAWGSSTIVFAWNDFLSIKIQLPDLKEQEKIVNTYNAITKRIQLKQKINENLEKTAQCLFDKYFKTPCEQIKQSAIIDNWKYKPLKSVASFTYGKMADDSIKVEKGYPIFSGYHNVGFSSEYMFELPQIVVLARGVSGTGEVKLSPEFCWLTNLSIAVLLNDRDYLFYYLFYLKNDNLRALDSGSAQSQITINNLGEHKVVIPPKEIAVTFNNKMMIINSLILKNEKEILKLQDLKQLLISQISKR